MTSTNDKPSATRHTVTERENVRQLHEPFAKTSSLNKTTKNRTICTTLKIIAHWKKKQTKSRNTKKKSAERKIAIRSQFSASERDQHKEGDGARGVRRGAIYYWGEAGGRARGGRASAPGPAPAAPWTWHWSGAPRAPRPAPRRII